MSGTHLGATAHHPNVVSEAVSVGLPPTQKHHVYLLPSVAGDCVKIGRTRNGRPLERIAALASIYPEIDLANAVLVEVDAGRVEKVLHFVFGQHRISHRRRQDGFSEWFSGNLIDDALDLLDIIARHRGTTYRVTRGLYEQLRGQGGRTPQTPQSTFRRCEAEKAQRANQAEDVLRAAILAQAHAVVSKLAERPFDAIVETTSRRYLVRTVTSATEPECWRTCEHYPVSAWGREMISGADVNISVDGASSRVRLLDLPVFVADSEESGREYYRIPEFRPADTADALSDRCLDRAAWSHLWDAIGHLRVAPIKSDPHWLRKPAAQASTPIGLV